MSGGLLTFAEAQMHVAQGVVIFPSLGYAGAPSDHARLAA